MMGLKTNTVNIRKIKNWRILLPLIMLVRFIRVSIDVSRTTLPSFGILGWCNVFRLILYRVKLSFCVFGNEALDPKIERINNKKHSIITNFLKSNFTVLSKENVPKQEGNPFPDKIWCCWWQGEQEMPPVVKTCYSTIINNSNGHEVILITKDNYNQFVEIPQQLIDFVNKGQMKVAHLADIIRFYLLYKYGGAWFDTTFFVSQPIGENLEFSYDFYSIHLKKPYNDNCIARCRWVSSIMFSKQGNPLIYNTYRILRDYFLMFNTCIDYLLLDYIIDYVQLSHDEYKEMIDIIPYNNEDFYAISRKYSEIYDKEEFDKLVNGDTRYFKLSYRVYAEKKIQGKLTIWGYLNSITPGLILP